MEDKGGQEAPQASNLEDKVEDIWRTKWRMKWRTNGGQMWPSRVLVKDKWRIGRGQVEDKWRIK